MMLTLKGSANNFNSVKTFFLNFLSPFIHFYFSEVFVVCIPQLLPGPASDLPGRPVGDQNCIDAFLLFLQIVNVQVRLGFLKP